jgi:hypothetical protein
MTITTILLLLGATWLAIGVVLAVVMGRRGYDSFVWWLLSGRPADELERLAMDEGYDLLVVGARCRAVDHAAGQHRHDAGGARPRPGPGRRRRRGDDPRAYGPPRPLPHRHPATLI